MVTSPAPLAEPLRRRTGQDTALRVVEMMPPSKRGRGRQAGGGACAGSTCSCAGEAGSTCACAGGVGRT